MTEPTPPPATPSDAPDARSEPVPEHLGVYRRLRTVFGAPGMRSRDARRRSGGRRRPRYTSARQDEKILHATIIAACT